MCTIITRRQHSSERRQEIGQRADAALWPKLRQAPGFVAAYVVAGDDRLTTGIAIFEHRAQLGAFRATSDAWGATTEALGSRTESRTEGEVLAAITPGRKVRAHGHRQPPGARFSQPGWWTW